MNYDFKGTYPYVIAEHCITIKHWTDLDMVFETMKKLYLKFNGEKDVQEQTILFDLKSAFKELNEKM